MPTAAHFNVADGAELVIWHPINWHLPSMYLTVSEGCASLAAAGMTREDRVGSVVKFHRGAAAVTGDEPCNPDHSGSHYSFLWEGAGRERSGSQKTSCQPGSSQEPFRSEQRRPVLPRLNQRFLAPATRVRWLSRCSVLFVWLLLSPSVNLAQSPVAVIDTAIAGSLVDSHPYSVIIDEVTMLGYATICGDVAPFGDPAEKFSNNKVIEFDARTLNVLRVFTVGYFPTEMILAHGDLWVTCSTASLLFRIDLDDGSSESIPLCDSTGAPISFPSGLELGPDGEIYVASNGGSFDGSDENLVSIDPVSHQILHHYSISGGISAIAYLEDDTLLVPVGFPGDDFTAAPVLYWIDPQSGEVLSELQLDVDTSDFPAPSDLEIVGDGTALVTIFGGSSDVYRVDLSTRSIDSIYAIPGGDTVQTSVVVDTDYSFIVSEFFSNRLSRIDLVSGELLQTFEGGNLPNRIAVAGGRIFTCQQGAEVISVHAGSGSFLRGDVHFDQIIDLADPIALLSYLFFGLEISCLDAGDISDDGVLDIGDPVQLLTYLFSGGPAPAYPFPVVGIDMTDDALDCWRADE